MRPRVLLLFALSAPAALAADAPMSGIVFRSATTSAEQPIALPQGPVEVVASITELAPGASTPIHKHPYPRFGYVLSGRIELSYPQGGETKVFEAGSFFADPVGLWHQGRALDGKAVRMLIIDQAPPGTSNFIPKEAPP
jgi:quercetin dioxygenase-like cupin family protein